MQRSPHKKREPLVYWLTWFFLAALLMALICACFYNTIPYHALVKRGMGISDRPLWGFELFNQQIKISFAWLVGAIFWVIIQGLQVGYWIITFSDKIMGTLISKTLNRQKHIPEKQDSMMLKHAKHKYNDAPLQILSFFAYGCFFAYGLEIAINFATYPAWEGGDLWGLFRALFDWSRFDGWNLFNFLMSLAAVELLVMALMTIWNLNQLLKETKTSQTSVY